MKNSSIFFKKTICCALSAALISMGGYTAVIADEAPVPLPTLSSDAPEATATPEPTETPAATEKPTAEPDSTATPNTSETDLRINASVYKESGTKTYRIVFKTGSALPEITAFTFTAKFYDATIKGFETGDTFSDNGSMSRSIRDDSEITCEWENGTSSVSGVATLFSVTVESNTAIKNSSLDVTAFTAKLPDGKTLVINPNLNVSDGTEIKELTSSEQNVYDELVSLPKVESMSFYKEDGKTYNDINTLYINPITKALKDYDSQPESSMQKIDDTLKANGTSLTAINAAQRAAEAMNNTMGIMKLRDAYYGVANDNSAINFEYLKKTAETVDMTVPTALKRAASAESQLTEAISKINEYNGYVTSALEKITDKTYENYNTKIMSLDIQLTSANKFTDHPYYSEYLTSIKTIAQNLRTEINANYSGDYKDYMLQSIDSVINKIESRDNILKDLPKFELPTTFTVGHYLTLSLSRSSNLNNQNAYVDVSVYKNGELIDQITDKAFAAGVRDIDISFVTNTTKYGRSGDVSVRCYYKVDSISYYLGEKTSSIFYSPQNSTFGTSGSGSGGGSTGGWSTNDENTSTNVRPTAIPDTSDYDEPKTTPVPNQADSNPYNDIDSYDWAREAIIGLTNAGIVNGMGDGGFNPAGNVTREQFCKMVVQMYGLDASEKSSYFDDVDENAWYAPYVTAAVNAGFVQGQSDDYFGIGESIMRQDMATILYRAINMTNDMAELNFTDNDNIAGYAKDAVAELVGLGIMNGYEDGSFKPRGSATRAEAAKVIWGIYNLAKY